MSRILSELLGVNESDFRINLAQLERVAGSPRADIRLQSQIERQTRAKIRKLGLDPDDTSGTELYAALSERFKADEVRLRQSISISDNADSSQILDKIKLVLEKLEISTDCFVVKPTVMRKLIKKIPPKITMKKLGYRSVDSMLKHEPIAQLLVAAGVYETEDWQRKRLIAYKNLSSTDFEIRPITFYLPNTKKWPELASQFVSRNKHNMMPVNELGAVVIMPLGQDLPGLAITTILLAFEYINEMRSLSSFLKLQQVRPGFGDIFVEAITSEPLTGVELAGRPLPWRIIQRFYGRGRHDYHPELFEPHVQPEDLTWHEAEQTLTGLHGALEFWQDGQMLALLDQGQPVSFNMLDVALSVCNRLPYGDRIVHYMRQSVWHELLSGYLHQESLEAIILGQLNQQLLPEPAIDDDETL
ncbi:MAG: hypothetical protein ABI220_01555 [Candidatus Saccharimonadales bacterium]